MFNQLVLPMVANVKQLYLPGPKTYSYRQTSTESVAESKSRGELHSSGDSACQLVPINTPSGTHAITAHDWLLVCGNEPLFDLIS